MWFTKTIKLIKPKQETKETVKWIVLRISVSCHIPITHLRNCAHQVFLRHLNSAANHNNTPGEHTEQTILSSAKLNQVIQSKQHLKTDTDKTDDDKLAVKYECMAYGVLNQMQEICFMET